MPGLVERGGGGGGGGSTMASGGGKVKVSAAGGDGDSAEADDAAGPFGTLLEAMEKRLRNLEKRKWRLQQVQSEAAASGRRLHPEQAAAVAKLGEVEAQIELARDCLSATRACAGQWREREQHTWTRLFRLLAVLGGAVRPTTEFNLSADAHKACVTLYSTLCPWDMPPKKITEAQCAAAARAAKLVAAGAGDQLIPDFAGGIDGIVELLDSALQGQCAPTPPAAPGDKCASIGAGTPITLQSLSASASPSLPLSTKSQCSQAKSVAGDAERCDVPPVVFGSDLASSVSSAASMLGTITFLHDEAAAADTRHKDSSHSSPPATTSPENVAPNVAQQLVFNGEVPQAASVNVNVQPPQQLEAPKPAAAVAEPTVTAGGPVDKIASFETSVPRRGRVPPPLLLRSFFDAPGDEANSAGRPRRRSRSGKAKTAGGGHNEGITRSQYYYRRQSAQRDTAARHKGARGDEPTGYQKQMGYNVNAEEFTPVYQECGTVGAQSASATSVALTQQPSQCVTSVAPVQPASDMQPHWHHTAVEQPAAVQQLLVQQQAVQLQQAVHQQQPHEQLQHDQQQQAAAALVAVPVSVPSLCDRLVTLPNGTVVDPMALAAMGLRLDTPDASTPPYAGEVYASEPATGADYVLQAPAPWAEQTAAAQCYGEAQQCCYDGQQQQQGNAAATPPVSVHLYYGRQLLSPGPYAVSGQVAAVCVSPDAAVPVAQSPDAFVYHTVDYAPVAMHADCA